MAETVNARPVDQDEDGGKEHAGDHHCVEDAKAELEIFLARVDYNNRMSFARCESRLSGMSQTSPHTGQGALAARLFIYTHRLAPRPSATPQAARLFD